MVLIYSRKRSSPSSSIFWGVSATLNNSRVARLTPASVACADNTTATRSVKGLRCSSSPLGSGLAFWKRSKTSRTSAGVQGFETFGFETVVFGGFEFLLDFLAERAGLVWALDLAFADFFGTDRTRAFLAR